MIKLTPPIVFHFVVFVLFTTSTSAQLYPVKVNGKWGMIDSTGQLKIKPIYDGIGEIKSWNYAIVQLEDKIGLLDADGKTLLSANYEQIKVIQKNVFSVKKKGVVLLINDKEKVLIANFDDLLALDEDRIAFEQQKKWGVVATNGNILLRPAYDAIAKYNEVFITQLNNKFGLASGLGEVWLTPTASRLKQEKNLFFYQINTCWGAIFDNGKPAFLAHFHHYQFIQENLVHLRNAAQHFLFNTTTGKLIELGDIQNVTPFSSSHLLISKNQKLGLIDLQGKLILPPVFEEIHPFHPHIFRTKKNGFWGLVTDQTQDLLTFQYDFIAPLKNQVSLIKKDNQFGLLDKLGNLVVPIEFERIEVQATQIKAYQKNEALVIYYLDEAGNISDHETEALDKHVTIRIKATASQPDKSSDLPVYQVNQFEWFYIAQQDRWGLRDINNGSTTLNPQFDYVKVLSNQAGAPDLTLVGIEQLTGLVFSQTAYQVEMLFGLVSNQIGKLITPLEFIHIALEDFSANLPAARCIFSNGKHGLVDRNGKVIARDLTYIDDFHHKVARFARNGKLSGAVERSEKLGNLSNYLDNMLSPYYMIDYTSYDQNFQEEASLICQDCTWGYLDSTGKEIVTPAYEFVLPFRAETGLVKSNQKWGMVNRKGQTIIPCQYDGVNYLTSHETILNVYVQADQFGLIDTLGALVLPTIYNEIGTYSEDMVAVKKAKLWGFADPKSDASIPCRYEAVSAFHDGLAAVKQDGKWGFIDQNGHTVIPFLYAKVGDFSEGLAWVQLSNGIGYINKKQEVVIPGNFARATAFKYGIASVMENGKWGLIDQTGKYLARPKFIEISEFDDNGLAIVSYGTDKIRYGVINTQGELLTSEPYLSVQPYSEGLAAVKQKESYGYIDTNGKLVIPAIYSKVSKFMEGRAAVQLNGVCGYINTQGDVAVDFEYSKCLEFSQGRAVVYKGYRKAGLLDELGNYVIEPALNHLIDFKEGRGLMRDQQYRFYYITEDADLHDGYYQDARQFQHGVGVVKMDNLWGIVNPQGIKIIPPKYDQISSFQEGYAKVRVKGFHGLLKATGEQLLPLEYEHIQQLDQQLFRVERGNEIGYFHVVKGWVWELKN